MQRNQAKYESWIRHGSITPFFRRISNKTIPLVLVVAALVVYFMLPLKLSFFQKPHSLVLLAKNNELLSARVAEDEQWRFPLISKVPERFSKSLICYEDQRFYSHIGVDFLALGRAMVQNIKEQRIVSGASTLTMQLARMHYSKERTILQKLKELLLAFKIDLRYDKKEILSLYASHAPFGGNVVGLDAASWRYFNKSSDYLSWAESASLAALPNSPGLINFNRNRKRLKSKRDFILDKLFNKGIIDSLEMILAKAEVLPNQIYNLPNTAPHLLEKARKDAITGRLKTTIDIDLQKKVNSLANKHYRSWSHSHIHNAGVLIVDNTHNNILTYLGNIPTSHHEKDVDMVRAKRSSGSILKPLLFASMIDEGQITPLTSIKDIPIMISGFQPSNYDGSFSGLVNASEVIRRSLNIPAVLMLRDHGIDKFLWKLRNLGVGTLVNSAEHYGLSLILGGGEVSLFDLCQVYSGMARELNDNFHNSQSLEYSDRSGNKDTDEGLHLFSKTSIWQTFEAMRQLTRPNEYGEWEHYQSSKTVAWKTGTSYGHRDAWAIGITPSFTIGVWVGNSDGEGRDEIIGLSTAGKMLFDIFELLPEDSEWFEEPINGTIVTSICDKSGMMSTQHCENSILMRLDEQAIKTPACKYHKTIYTNMSMTYQVTRDCLGDEDFIKSKYFDLPPTVSKYYSRKNLDYKNVPPFHPRCAGVNYETSRMQFIFPSENDKIHLPMDLNGKVQELIVELNHKNQDAQVFWYLDNEYLGSTRAKHQMGINGAIGHHTLYCLDTAGQSISLNFTLIGTKDLASNDI